MKKVSMDWLKVWISQRIIQLLSFEDDVLVDYVYSLLEETVFFCCFLRKAFES